MTITTWAALHRTPGYQAMVTFIADELGDEAADALRARFVLGETVDVRRVLGPIGGDLRLDEIAGTARFVVRCRLGAHRRARVDARRPGGR